MGALVGDALGVPVEFMTRAQVRRNPVSGMRGFGTHNMPAGTWSDDSSLLLCTVESLLGGFDTADMAARFLRWLKEAYWTPHGKVFDVGQATRTALGRIARGAHPLEAGCAGERENGNGSLMRILPVALRFAGVPEEELLMRAHECSSITHRHPRSMVACGIYCMMASALVRGLDAMDAYRHAAERSAAIYADGTHAGELTHFQRVLGGRLASLDEDRIRSSGYVLDTLEAGVWSVLTTSSFSEAVLKAVNLGDDTDTTACVAGGLAGLAFGLKGIPARWIEGLARRANIGTLVNKFLTACEPVNYDDDVINSG